ncbi:AraC family transcriptional regulator [Enemella dayhoffiae]|uniref:AraC family transcriptional regulator n=1 Tax=Enemella dayhoffiae TaxID=2016507 RepID=A0A255HCQ8_9ACTN|nr:AraC family transcriptional regulator [Enemella dayhoffiae]OYO25046.1 AraC family transcriptional regulator [Enemella dayhoffiae]
MSTTTPVRRRLHTRDVDRARTEIGQLFCPHELRPGRSGVDVRLAAHRSGPVGVVGLDYGHLVRITPGALETFYLVMVPLGGRARIDHGNDRIVSDPSVAAVLSPVEQVDMLWGERNPQLLCWLERSAIEREVALLTDGSVSGPVRFQTELRINQPGVRPWLAQVRRLWQELSRDQAQVRHWERSVLTSLLTTQPHNHSVAISHAGGDAATVRRATAWMEARIGQAISMPQVAASVGVGVRQLQKAFRAELDDSPAAWLKQRRMILARERLQAALPGSTTVTSIASGLSINHLGRFSTEYREAFGESPSDTLNRLPAIA